MAARNALGTIVTTLFIGISLKLSLGFSDTTHELACMAFISLGCLYLSAVLLSTWFSKPASRKTRHVPCLLFSAVFFYIYYDSYWYTAAALAFSIIYALLYPLYAFKDGMLPLVVEKEASILPAFAAAPTMTYRASTMQSQYQQAPTPIAMPPQGRYQQAPSPAAVPAQPQYQVQPPAYSAPSHQVKN